MRAVVWEKFPTNFGNILAAAQESLGCAMARKRIGLPAKRKRPSPSQRTAASNPNQTQFLLPLAGDDGRQLSEAPAAKDVSKQDGGKQAKNGIKRRHPGDQRKVCGDRRQVLQMGVGD